MKALIVLLLWSIFAGVMRPAGSAGADSLAGYLAVVDPPLKIIAIAAEALLALVRSILFLPARILGYREYP
jgi:hypothetical protein